MLKHAYIYAGAAALALFAGPAFALQNVANTSQKGSLLIWPLITVDTAQSSNTLIEISNDQNSKVHIECYYVNEKKGRVDFDFWLTPKQTASWEVLSGTGDIATPLFPTGGTFPGNARKGELICFATDDARQKQIAFNHLTGTATVVHLKDPFANQPKQAFRYNPWSFIARDTSGLPAADYTVQGTPGDLQLTGANDGKSYDGCPKYNIVNFMPNNALLDGARTLDNDLAGVSCNQDLRQDYLLHTTKLKFTLWNANEVSYTGTYICVDSVFSVDLGPKKVVEATTSDPGLVNGTNFDYSVLKTTNARYQVKGVPSTQCPEVPYGVTERSGLLGVATSGLAIGGGTLEDQEVASTTHTAGVYKGYVLWDVGGIVHFKK